MNVLSKSSVILRNILLWQLLNNVYFYEKRTKVNFIFIYLNSFFSSYSFNLKHFSFGKVCWFYLEVNLCVFWRYMTPASRMAAKPAIRKALNCLTPNLRTSIPGRIHPQAGSWNWTFTWTWGKEILPLLLSDVTKIFLFRSRLRFSTLNVYFPDAN